MKFDAWPKAGPLSERDQETRRFPVSLPREGAAQFILKVLVHSVLETPSNVRIRMGSLRFGHQLLRFEGGTNGGGADTIATHSFVGEIQHLRVNGVPLSESLRPGEISGFSIESNILPPGLIQASGSLLLSR